ncbi:MAG: class I SAM-dependent methyltransferase [Deltaproteobacteria bacterium]|nr:class I SAM-dependent methyltransferase [Deltaproteobacteria bacterium]
MAMTQGQWRQKSAIFHDRAHEYDQWFEDSLLFEIELTALRELQTHFSGPKIEIGVGPGRFAQALHVDVGVDPALAPLRLASSRNISVVQAIGEELPVASNSFGCVYLLFTLCFLAEPTMALNECCRILKPGGHLVLGMAPLSGAWGKSLQAKKERNHPFYRHAVFYHGQEVLSLLEESGFVLKECRSSLFQGPEELSVPEHSRLGLDERGGFCLLVGEKK